MKRWLPRTLLLLLAYGALFATRASAHPGWGIVVDRQGQVFFTDLANIWKIDAQGKVSRVVTGKHSHALYLDETGNLYGEHLTYESEKKLWWTSVWKLTPTGTLVEVVPPTVGAQFPFPSAVDAHGNTYFREGPTETERELRIYRKTPDGRTTMFVRCAWGQAEGDGKQAKYHGVGNMAIGPDGSPYVIAGSSVRKVGPNGGVTTLASGLVAPIPFYDPAGGGRFSRLMGLAVDLSGNVYVANYGNRRVLKITPAGQVTTLLRANWFWSPSGVAAAGQDVLVLESTVLPPFRTRVRKVSPDGRVATLATVK